MSCPARVLTLTLLFAILSAGCDEEPTRVSNPRFSDSVERSFSVADLCTLQVDNFVGGVKVQPGPAGVVRVTATKWARREGDLTEIDIDMVGGQNAVDIVTDNPTGAKDVSVDLEITAPWDTRPKIQTGVGGIRYVGRAEGECRFDTGVGTIRLELPAGVNVSVELAVGVGRIYCDFSVDGYVTARLVDGTIGTGTEGEIYASVGVGDIRVIKQ